MKVKNSHAASCHKISTCMSCLQGIGDIRELEAMLAFKLITRKAHIFFVK